MKTQMKYRADIDGLRAFAVLSVLAFHMEPTWLPGGFAGVDVFFVISGFLITGIIAEQIREGRFSLTAFYRNRINRIFPALFVMIVISLLAGLVMFSPQELLQLARSALAAVLGVSNVLFWREYGGYFAAAAHEAPLLHTWSLAVEEQFYMLWPLLLLGLLHPRLRQQAPLLLALLVLALAGVSEIGTKIAASASYYLLPTRFFELALGGLTSLLLSDGIRLRWSVLHALMALIGLLLVLGSFVWLRGSAFPGINAIYPCLGAALLIVAGDDANNPISRLLAWRGFVAIGLISYSLYLWHWPIIVAFNYFYVDSGIGRALAIVVLSFMAAWTSWRFVEERFRRGSAPFRRVFVYRYVFPMAGLAIAVIAIIAANGLPQRFPASIALMDEAIATQPNVLRAGCHVPTLYYDKPLDPACVLGDRQQAISGLLVGDSFANHFSGMVDEIARVEGLALQDYTMDACLPLRDFVQGLPPSYAEKCRRRNEVVYEQIASGHYRLVVLGGQWPDATLVPRMLMGKVVSEESYWLALEAALRQSLQQISKSGASPVVILSNAVIVHANSCPVRRLTLGLDRDCSAPRVTGRMELLWAQLAQDVPALRFIDPNGVLCPGGRCQAILQGVPLYRDYGHLNDRGSRLLGRLLLAKVHARPLLAVK